MTPSHLPTFVLSLLLALAGTATPLGGATSNPCADGGTGPSHAGADRTGRTVRPPVGVIGTVTGFGSLCIGPTEIHYDSTTAVTVDGTAADAGALAVGQVVEVVADRRNRELHARAVAVRHVVVGPITEVDALGYRLAVAGQRVLRPEDSDRVWRVGDVVQVSGMRRDDGWIVATAIAEANPFEVSITGPWTPDPSGGGAIVATRVTGATGDAIRGAEVRILGQWAGETLRARRFEVLPAVPFDGTLDRIQVEGFTRRDGRGAFAVGPYSITESDVDFSAFRDGNRRVRVEAVVRNARFVPISIVPISELRLRQPQPVDVRSPPE